MIKLTAISSKVDATALDAANSAHADNKAYHVGQGMYRVDWPDAAFDSGVGKKVTLIVVCTGVDTTFLEVELSPHVTLAATQGSYAPAKAGDAMTITDSTTLNSIADAILKRDWTEITGEATRSLLNAARTLLNKWTLTTGAGGYVVKKEDDSTTAWTGTPTVDGNGNVSGMDHD